MAVTKTEKLFGKLNYTYASRQSLSKQGRNDCYTEALRDICNIYGNQIEKGLCNDDDINSFYDQLSLVSVLSNRDLYVGIDSIPLEFGKMIEANNMGIDVARVR